MRNRDLKRAHLKPMGQFLLGAGAGESPIRLLWFGVTSPSIQNDVVESPPVTTSSPRPDHRISPRRRSATKIGLEPSDD
jgi:hypothetical protein